MIKKEYHNALSSIVTNALLHLHCHIASQSRFVPITQRNALLIKRLKADIQKKKYAIAKRDIKALILIGRKQGGNVEEKLWELNRLNLQTSLAPTTHAEALYELLSQLFDQHDYKSHLASPGETLEDNVIYMYQSEIENGFDDNNCQIRPLNIFMQTSNPTALITAVRTCCDNHTITLSKVENGIAHYTIDLTLE